MSMLHLVECLIGLIWLRALIRVTGSEYAHTLLQIFSRYADLVLARLPGRQAFLGPVPLLETVLAFAVAALFWLIWGLAQGAMLPQLLILVVLTPVKCAGYLFVFLLFAQALSSWLPQTRSFSSACDRLCAPLTRPVQRLIPPIGMIDISLMVVLLAVFALNYLLARLLGLWWMII